MDLAAVEGKSSVPSLFHRSSLTVVLQTHVDYVCSSYIVVVYIYSIYVVAIYCIHICMQYIWM